jgi:hypothetical protein
LIEINLAALSGFLSNRFQRGDQPAANCRAALPVEPIDRGD